MDVWTRGRGDDERLLLAWSAPVINAAPEINEIGVEQYPTLRESTVCERKPRRGRDGGRSDPAASAGRSAGRISRISINSIK
jgi:hypothetical protein